jgi:hypothetical protein
MKNWNCTKILYYRCNLQLYSIASTWLVQKFQEKHKSKENIFTFHETTEYKYSYNYEYSITHESFHQYGTRCRIGNFFERKHAFMDVAWEQSILDISTRPFYFYFHRQEKAFMHALTILRQTIFLNNATCLWEGRPYHHYYYWIVDAVIHAWYVKIISKNQYYTLTTPCTIFFQ